MGGQALRATFFLFQKRKQGGVIARATLGYVLVMALIIAAFLAVTWGSWVQFFGLMQQAGAGGKGDPSAVFGIFAIFGWVLIFLFFFYVALASYEAACLRWMIRGETGGFLGLTLGADTGASTAATGFGRSSISPFRRSPQW